MNDNWKPNEEEIKYLDLVLSMTVDSKMETGVVNRETYISNLRFICDQMEEIPKKVTNK